MNQNCYTHQDICDSTVHAAFLKHQGMKKAQDKAVHAVSVLLKTALIDKKIERVIDTKASTSSRISYRMTPAQAAEIRTAAIARASAK